MKRKINRVGQNTLTVSLPSKWAKQHKLQPGDEVELVEEAKALIVSIEPNKPYKKATVINADLQDQQDHYLSLSKYLTILYKTGYTNITILHSKGQIANFKTESKSNIKDSIKKITNRLMGMEIVNQTDSKTEIESFIVDEHSNLDTIGRRIYFLMKETINEIFTSIGPEFDRFEDTMYDRHDNITKFINFFLRELYVSNVSEDEKKVAYAFYSQLDMLVDKLRHICEQIKKRGCSEKAKKHLKTIFDIFDSYFGWFKNKNISRSSIVARYNFKKTLDDDRLSADDLHIIKEAYIFLESLNLFAEYSLVRKAGEK